MCNSFSADKRGAAIQIGALLLFATTIVALSAYQASVVPQQNGKIEFAHSKQIDSDLVDFRDTILRTSGRDVQASVGLQLGTTYPARIITANPPPPSGTIRTTGTSDAAVAINITNASATGETAEFWNGTQQTYSTGFVSYEASYSEYKNPPKFSLDNTILYRQYRTGSQVSADESLVNGRDITLIVINGSVYQRSNLKRSVEITPLSAGREPVQVSATSNTEPLTITFDSTRSPRAWRQTHLSEKYDPDGTEPEQYITEISGTQISENRYEITLVFETDQSYTLRMAKVGVGTQLTQPTATYLTSPSAESQRIQEGETVKIQATVRDEYNNPIGGATVNASVGTDSDGQLISSKMDTADSDGKVEFTYQAPSSQSSTAQQQINFTLGQIGKHSETAANSTELNITVQTAVSGNNDGSSSGSTGNPSGDDSECLQNITAGDKLSSSIVVTISNSDSCNSVNITHFGVSTPDNNGNIGGSFTHLEERTQKNHEGQFSIGGNGGVDGFAEAQNESADNTDGNTAKKEDTEANKGDDLQDFTTNGDFYNFTLQPVIPSGATATAEFEFARQSNGQELELTYESVDSEADVTITLSAADGTTKEIYLKVTSTNG